MTCCFLMLLLPFNHHCDFLFFPAGGLIIYHFKQQLCIQTTSLRTHMGYSCAFCLLSCNVGPLLLLTSIVTRARFIIHSWPGPLHTSVNTAASRWAWMGFSDHLFAGHTHKKHWRPHWHTCYPNQITYAVPALCLAGVRSTSQKVNKQRDRGTSHSSPLLREEVMSTKFWPQQECGLNEHQGKDKYSRRH